MNEGEIEVHAELAGRTHLVGILRVMARSGRNSATFIYDDGWRGVAGHFSLEPSMAVGRGVFAPDKGRDMFASIGDSAPDTWGRRLMQRMERKTAKRQNRAVRTLTEADYLLGVADVARLGALRFRRVGQDAFQSPLRENGVPPFIELPRLLSVTERVLRDEETDDDLLLLFAPGSSLGGARPKASVADKDGHLAIAKFPNDDDYSIETWEEVALRLAGKAGIRTAEHRLERVARKPVLVSRRFDRDAAGHRVPFLSAMSMVNLVGGGRGSYPELVDVLRTHGSDTDADAEELFRRMVFNILVSNVDDHLRNHGFLWTGETGWRLSPAYDLNPVPVDVKAHILSTNISLDEGTCSIELARENAEYFGVSAARADEIVGEVAAATSQWRDVAASLRIKASEIDRMSTAFEHDELQLALSGRVSVPVR
ncbi:type II toxin-antitoxin system HipA family toxin [Siccirubricoccus sp. KC 17139]|uniref:Type II toxin-antitoxin system HipA family toxin n=1 Tax=Siccirubricoccus soli TaxID=2899147 RepID=A0ABT1D2M0_9PROT|nr:type II toxin-antitoxin system HipA family toxin [Siccirubricoccus soli]MCO6416182.1 type II toxin-antitoxin system HipA family toxin [Siccirubricoccus soli]MCP2682316.1 type II toxin-antitoxin system HipA family toxin [Siccirubricoccus soli]